MLSVSMILAHELSAGRLQILSLYYTVEPGYIEHSRETEIGSIERGFVISEHLLQQFKSKGNETPFDIGGI